MSEPRRTSDTRIPWSAVLVAVGTILIITVAVILVLMPTARQQIPELVPRLVLATREAPPPNIRLVAPPTPLSADELGIPLLPESPREPGVQATPLPSQARVEEAASEPAAFSAGRPVRLVIPDLDIDAPVRAVGLHETSVDGQSYRQWSVPEEYAAGWHSNTAPLGQPGNTVLNGHHNVHGEIFRNLADVEAGAEIVLYDAERSYTYRVMERYVLEERGMPLAARRKNARFVLPTSDQRVTLVSCWPYTDNTHRVIVVAYPVVP